MSKRGVKLKFQQVRGVKKLTGHIKRSGKKKQPVQSSTFLNAPMNPAPSQYINSRPVN